MPVFIDSLELDLAVSEGHRYPSQVTKRPVEKGSDIADHVHNEPVQVTLEGVVSDTPYGALAERRSEHTLPSAEAFEFLKQLRIDKRIITLQTDLGFYENMVLADLDVPRSRDSGDALRFSATFEQIEIVTNTRTRGKPKTPRGHKKKNLGHKAAIQVGAPFPELPPKWGSGQSRRALPLENLGQSPKDPKQILWQQPPSPIGVSR